MIAIDELIFTVLTQNTSDLNAERAYDSLRKVLPTWGQVIEAETSQVAEAIKHGGLSNQKSVRIQKILVEILKRLGHFELEFLADRPLEEAREWFTSLPGVGPKTAAVVMVFSLKMPAFPVDTHIHRVSKRLGLIEEKTTADQAHPIMEELLPEDDRYDMHMLLITHGREICKARIPQCPRCPLPKNALQALFEHLQTSTDPRLIISAMPQYLNQIAKLAASANRRFTDSAVC